MSNQTEREAFEHWLEHESEFPDHTRPCGYTSGDVEYAEREAAWEAWEYRAAHPPEQENAAAQEGKRTIPQVDPRPTEPPVAAAPIAQEPLRDLLIRLLQWDHFDGAGDGPFWRREIQAALAAPQVAQEPVATMVYFKRDGSTTEDCIPVFGAPWAHVDERLITRTVPLYAAPIAAPAGWKMVPVEPTTEMTDASRTRFERWAANLPVLTLDEKTAAYSAWCTAWGAALNEPPASQPSREALRAQFNQWRDDHVARFDDEPIAREAWEAALEAASQPIAAGAVGENGS